MHKKDKITKIQKANQIHEDLNLQKHGVTPEIKNLSYEHITQVLGIQINLHENVGQDLIQKILKEQIIYENFLDTLKNFAADKINKTIQTIKDWKDAAAIFYQIITAPDGIKVFGEYFWNGMKNKIIKPFYTWLTKLGIGNLQPIIEKFISKINSLKGWQKFLLATTVAAIMQYMINWMEKVGEVKKMPLAKIQEMIKSYLMENGMSEIINKLTDFTTYIAWIKPIIGTVDALYQVLKPAMDGITGKGPQWAINLTKNNPFQKT